MSISKLFACSYLRNSLGNSNWVYGLPWMEIGGVEYKQSPTGVVLVPL